MVHPDRVVDAAGFAKLPLIDPVYPLTEGLHPNQVRKAVEAALDRVPKTCRNGRTRLGSSATAFREFRRKRCARVHRPQTPDDLAAGERCLVAARL